MRERRCGAAVLAGVVAAISTQWLTRALRARPPGGPHRWSRMNHAGRLVTLLGGPGYVGGALFGAAAGSLLSPAAGPPVLAAVGSGAAGLLDDLAGDSNKGLRGHLSALRAGRVTTGAVKVVALAATGLAAAAAVDRDRRGVATLIGGAVIAGSANLANLLDLRPGRAAKATVLLGIPLALTGERAAACAVGAALGTLPSDLAGETMLGDTGANAAGALVGLALVSRTGGAGRVMALAVLSALTLASERVSFTAVIESTPLLREVDAWGRR